MRLQNLPQLRPRNRCSNYIAKAPATKTEHDGHVRDGVRRGVLVVEVKQRVPLGNLPLRVYFSALAVAITPFLTLSANHTSSGLAGSAADGLALLRLRLPLPPLPRPPRPRLLLLCTLVDARPPRPHPPLLLHDPSAAKVAAPPLLALLAARG
eukprot:scaffold9322_cov120-Isochrysis_galbana.AAC.9